MSPHTTPSQTLSTSSYILVALTIVYQLAYVWQGLDFTDTGWHMTAYQQIFEYPESMQYSFMYWLSCICGGLLYEIWPDGGLLANRLASVVVHSLIFWLYYKLLKQIMKPNLAVQGLVSSLLFFQFYGFESLNYDSFSLLALSGAVYLFAVGLTERRYGYIYIGAAVCGVSTYFRLTNLSAVSLLPLVGFCLWLYDTDLRQIIKVSLLMLTAYVTGHVAVISLMYAMGHLTIFTDNIALVRQMGADPDYSHNLPYVLYLYAKGWVKTGAGAAAVAALAYGITVLQRKVAATVVTAVLILLAIPYLYLLYLYPEEVWSKMRYAYLGAITLATIYIVYRGDTKVMVIGLLAFALMAIFPLGANSGVEKMYFAVGLSGALLYQHIHQYYTAASWTMPKRWLLVLYAITCLSYGYRHTYWDPGSRLAKIATVQHTGLHGIHTTEARAASVEELIAALGPVVQAGDYLLAFSDIPMVHYLTGARPYILTSWPRLYDSLQNFTDRMAVAEREHGLPSVVVMHKMEMRSPWPTNTTPTYLQVGSNENRLPQHYDYMRDWLDARPYQLAWENDVFTIYTIE